MPRSRYEGMLNALYQTPPFQKIMRAVDGAEGDMIKYLHDYFKGKISEALWGNNAPRYRRHVLKRENSKPTSEVEVGRVTDK
jgi:hypothetical protein